MPIVYKNAVADHQNCRVASLNVIKNDIVDEIVNPTPSGKAPVCVTCKCRVV